jgi:hypothetical protein
LIVYLIFHQQNADGISGNMLIAHIPQFAFAIFGKSLVERTAKEELFTKLYLL